MNYEEILLKLGITSKLKGYHYILESIKILKNQTRFQNIMFIYELVAKNYKTNYLCIERNIRTCVISSYFRKNILHNIYGKKPDNKSFIYDLIYNKEIFEKEINRYE